MDRWMRYDKFILRVYVQSHIHHDQANPAFFISYNMCLPIKEGDLDTTMPASSKALILL